MDDILSHGGDRDPSPWPRRLAVIAVLVAVVAGGVVYLARPHHPHAPAAAHPTATPASVAASVAPPGPSGILGRTLAWDPSVRLPEGGSRPSWFSPGTGRSRVIGGLPAEPAGYQFTRVVGGWAVQVASVTKTACGDCAGRTTPTWFLGDSAQSAVQVGLANRVTPGATAGTIWLTSYAPGTDTATAAGTATEVNAHGAVLAKPVRLPSGYAIDRGTDRGLLLVPVRPRPGTAPAKLWDPSVRSVTQVFSQVVAAGPGDIAWLSPCSPRCGVQVLDLATGRRTRLALPAGQSVASATFSPDGSFLALQVSSASAEDGEQALRLEVASVASGRLTEVPGTFVSSDALLAFGWPARGDSLVAEFSFTTRNQLASWQPGASRLAVAGIRTVPSEAMLSLG